MADSNESYLRLITSEYADKPKFNSFVESFLKQVSPINDIFTSYSSIFNLDTAIGDQLDKIGHVIGIGRELPISNENIPAILTDDLYRKVLQARIYSNFWDGTYEGLNTILEATFPEYSYQLIDNQDMTMQLIMIIPVVDSALVALLLEGYILPKPSGVSITYTIQEKPLFAWNVDTAALKGWDEGTWNTN